jgi:hypothetical protein
VIELSKKPSGKLFIHETSAMRSPSSEDKERSTTGAFLKDPPCSHTGERGQREETTSEDFNGGSDPEGAGGGVLAPFGDELSSFEGERACLLPLLITSGEQER